MDEDPSFRFAAWSEVCSDACYCSATCTQAYGFFDEYDLYSLKQVCVCMRSFLTEGLQQAYWT